MKEELRKYGKAVMATCANEDCNCKVCQIQLTFEGLSKLFNNISIGEPLQLETENKLGAEEFTVNIHIVAEVDDDLF